MSSLLTLIIFCPLVAAMLLVLVPRDYRFVARLIALGATFITMLLAVILFFKFKTGMAGYQFEDMAAWIPTLGITYHVGVDGINIGLIVMGAIVAFAAACCSWEIQSREKEFYILLLVMITGILGAFASLDLFFFYFFHELALVPTFIMIGVWGRGRDKNYAAFNITIYLSVGALIALIGLIAVYLQMPAGERSFDIVDMTKYFKHKPMKEAVQQLVFPLLLFGFGILVSLWPFHTWAPLGYSSAPTPTAMLHAGVLKKFGLYGLIRVALPLMPEGAQSWMQVLAVLCLGNIVFCSLVAIRQKNLNYLIGNSSVAHMGFIFLGIASLSILGVTGAVLVMIAHGFLAALSFGLSGYLYQQTKTLEMERLGGLLRKLPFVGAALIMAMLAGCGLPGFANFAGEVMVFFGAWKAFTFVTVLACWGALILGAVYMLRGIRNILHGPVSSEWNSVQDAGLWRKVPFALLLLALLVVGFYPRLLTDKIQPSAAITVKLATGLRLDSPAKAPGKGVANVQMVH